jgi:hypothetical protein
MSPDWITELKRMEAEASPGPWDVLYAGWPSTSECEFVTAMRNALPHLLALVENAVGLAEWARNGASEKTADAAVKTARKWLERYRRGPGEKTT